jgi:predicted DNA-binding protein
MRKRVLTKQVAVVLSEETHQQIIEVTDKLEISISMFIREIIEEKINRNKGEESHE